MRGVWGQSERFYGCIPKTFSGVLEEALRGGVGPGWKGWEQAHSASCAHACFFV